MSNPVRRWATLGSLLPALTVAVPAASHAQGLSPEPQAGTPSIKLGGSPNVEVLAHLPRGGYFRVGGIDIDQDPARPYVYLHTWKDESGFDVIDISDPRNPEVILQWRFERANEYEIGRGENIQYFKRGDRHYVVLPHETNEAGGIDADLCAVVFDVTGLPDPSSVREITRIREPDVVRGCIYAVPYMHSDGRLLLFIAPDGVAKGTMPHVKIYDADRLLAGAEDWGYIGNVPLPDNVELKEEVVQEEHYHDFYVQYDPEARRDRIYAAGPGGFHIYDVTRPEAPAFVGSVAEGRLFGHTIVATPDSRMAVTTNELQHLPLRIWDLTPLLEGEMERVEHHPEWLGSWTADWRNVPHNMEVRWPFVFVAAYEDGLQVFEMRDPAHPRTVGWYYTCQCGHLTGFVSDAQLRGPSVYNGALQLDVRNVDGLIALSDLNTGLWLFKLDGFDGWDGRDYGVPNLSSAQDWENGPTGATPSR